MNTLQTVSKLVELKSYSTEENSQIIDFLISKFEPYSKEMLKVKKPNSNIYNLLVGFNTKIYNTQAIILSGHIDTVVANETYSTNPFEATVIDNKLYGLGVIDMKCYFATIIDNLDTLSKSNIPIIVAITGDEETELVGITQIIDVLKNRNVQPIISIIGEPTNKKICTSSNGCYEYEIKITGKSGHSSKPQDGVNASYIMAKLILAIESLNLKYPNTTLNCGIATAGQKVNIIPGCAKINFDIRSKSKENVEKALLEIKNVISSLEKLYLGAKINIEQQLNIPALEKTNPILTNRLINELNLIEDEFSGGCEAGYFQELGGEAILFGTGDIALAHKPDEFLDIQSFYDYNNMFLQMINKINEII